MKNTIFRQKNVSNPNSHIDGTKNSPYTKSFLFVHLKNITNKKSILQNNRTVILYGNSQGFSWNSGSICFQTTTVNQSRSSRANSVSDMHYKVATRSIQLSGTCRFICARSCTSFICLCIVYCSRANMLLELVSGVHSSDRIIVKNCWL